MSVKIQLCILADIQLLGRSDPNWLREKKGRWENQTRHSSFPNRRFEDSDPLDRTINQPEETLLEQGSQPAWKQPSNC